MSTSTPKREWKCNGFLMTVFKISQELGLEPHRIVPLFQQYSSSNFICGTPTCWNWKQIPGVVFQKVCEHYSIAAYKPYRPKPIVTERVLFKVEYSF